MSANRAHKGSVLPNNPRWVTIEATDGDARRWPTNTSYNPDAEGYVNFMQPLSLDDPLSIKWRIIIGQRLAEMLQYPDLDSKDWVLKTWPASYQFYDHNKGQENGVVRHDLYLVGSEHVNRFRSPPEFIPHAYWLMTDPTLDRGNCNCKYCAKKPQREISDAFGLSQRQSSSQARIPVEFPRTERDKEKERRKRTRGGQQVHTAVRRAPKPIKLKGPKQFVDPERENDLRAALGPKSLGTRRWARERELVWVKLDHPIALSADEDAEEVIMFWPGLIEDVHFKTETIPKENEDIVMTDGNALNGHDETDEDVPWIIVHKSVYKIKLLLVSKTIFVGDDHILPYQSHAPGNKVLSAVQSVYIDPDKFVDNNPEEMVLPSAPEENSGDGVTRLFKQFEQFDPFPRVAPVLRTDEERRTLFETAAGPFAVAIQIASRLTAYWTPSNMWQYKMLIPSGPSYSADMGISSASRTPLPPQELQALGQRVLGTQLFNNEIPSTQTRYQGLWWGPERIWMGDLVRLKLARYQLAPAGAEKIKTISGAGKSARQEIRDESIDDKPLSAEKGHAVGVDAEMHDLRSDSISLSGIDVGMRDMDMEDVDKETKEAVFNDPNCLGASSRSIFMRIDGIFVVQVPQESGHGTLNEGRMCGMLYELADEDWESEGDEFPGGRRTSEANPSNPTDTISQSSKPVSGAMTATPHENLTVSDEGSTSLAQLYNNSAAQQVVSTTSTLFAPNPELLSELPGETSATAPVQANGVQSDANLGLLETLLETAPLPSSSAITEENQSTSTKTAPPNPSLSGPLEPAENTYPHPSPPKMCKFRPILPESHEAVLPLTLIAGRYYPALLSNELMRERVEAAKLLPHTRQSDALWALEGFVAGYYNSVDPSEFLPSRVRMIREAEKKAWDELVEYWRQRIADKNAIVIDDD
ncbi:hypothetical protein DFH11DRAFT_1506352 [Phellopilus nigrolimitatus]|nr:hypothetical protein DFH11DRAFT_1506352 [Phellopilus nigrolimitatus]